MSCDFFIVVMHRVRYFSYNTDKNTKSYCCMHFYVCVHLMEFCVFIFFEKITEAFVFVDHQHFVNKKQHLFFCG